MWFFREIFVLFELEIFAKILERLLKNQAHSKLDYTLRAYFHFEIH